MLSPGMLVRGLAVAAFASSPLAALGTTPTPNIATGDAIAAGPGVGADNTGGNVSIDNGHIVDSPPFLVPVAPQAAPLSVPTKPVNPAADAIARANKLVADAKAHAQALIDAARAQAEAAVEQAHQQAEDAQARGQAQSNAAQQRSAEASAQAHS